MEFLYMKIFSQDLKEYNISCVNAISIVNAGSAKFENDELVIKAKELFVNEKRNAGCYGTAAKGDLK